VQEVSTDLVEVVVDPMDPRPRSSRAIWLAC